MNLKVVGLQEVVVPKVTADMFEIEGVMSNTQVGYNQAPTDFLI